MYGKRKKYETARYFDRINYADSETIITDRLRADEDQAQRFANFIEAFHDQTNDDQPGRLAQYDGDAYTGCTAEGYLIHIRCKREAPTEDPGSYYVAFGSLHSDAFEEMVVRGVYTPNSQRPFDHTLEVRPPHGSPHDLLPRDQQRLSWHVGAESVEFFYKNGLRNPLEVPIVGADTIITALAPERDMIVELVEQPVTPVEPAIAVAA